MLLWKAILILWMMAGVICTLAPNLPGTAMIALGIAGYYMATEVFLPSFFWPVVLTVVLIAELGGRLVRGYLMKQQALHFVIDTAVGNFAGVLMTSAFIGTLPGILVWQTLIGKTLMPSRDDFIRGASYLFILLLLRGVCGLILFGLAANYLFMP